jgi:Cu-Zn family superoxide dismutase
MPKDDAIFAEIQTECSLHTGCLIRRGLFHYCNLAATDNEQTVIMHAVSAQGVGAEIGTTISLHDSPAGLVIRTSLSQLPPGPHGFHIHEKGSCDPAMKDGKAGAALAAGSHYNPNHAPHHGNPLTGHLGDLPLLNVVADELQPK